MVKAARSRTAGALVDADSASFLASFFFHVCLLCILAYAPVLLDNERVALTITTPLEEEHIDEDAPPPAEQFQMNDLPMVEIGANSVNSGEMALAAAEILSDLSQVPSPVDVRPVDEARLETNVTIELATGMRIDNLPVRGSVGEGTTGAQGAIDRITQDILLSLEERPTLVVWLFDQSGSLLRQRAEINARLDRIYEELGVIEAAGNPAFRKHQKKPLLTAVMAFGDQVQFLLEKPSDDILEIKQAVAGITLDDKGIERAFTAVYRAAERYKRYRLQRPHRNLMLIVVTDEAGDDQSGVDETVRLCQRYEIPVYVVGVPAPFGRRETLVKWVDPDPKFDQTPQWGRVDQGPESLVPERIKLDFFGRSNPDPMDSGFGPFALTRLCYETGGVYFTVHPNRNSKRGVSRGETAEFSAHLKRFFDPSVMRRYRPDYVSATEYMRRANSNKARATLLRAAQLSSITQMAAPVVRFVKRNEAQMAAELTEAQKAAAVLEPTLNSLYETLKLGEEERKEESYPRWQAGYDLAMGRVLAAKVRTESYNAMLAVAKRGLEFKNPKNNTWQLVPHKEITVSSQLAKAGEAAVKYLQQVVAEHPGTPWEVLANRELATPLGWQWQEKFTNLTPPRPRRPGGGGRPRPGTNERAKKLRRPPPKRPPPKL